MNGYIYEMHQHTAWCSLCGKADPIAMVHSLKSAGFSGVVMTDHFYHGNTAVRRNQPWEEFVRAYDATYRYVRAEGEKLDFDVLFGFEVHVGEGKEMLVYGLTPDALYRHPELQQQSIETLSRAVRAEGGLVFQAHPFRVRDYIPEPWKPLPFNYLDGVEVNNLHNTDLENLRARMFAEDNGLLTCAGSDDHALYRQRYGIISPHRLRDEKALGDLLRSGNYTLYP